VSVRGALQRALSHHERGELALAAEFCRSALRHAPHEFDALYLLGVLEFQQRRYVEAANLFRRATELDPANAGAHSNLGLTLYNLRRLDEALASYARAVELKPGFCEAWYNRGVVFEELGREEEALASYNRSIELNAGLAAAHFNRGNVLRVLRRHEAALASYDAAIAVNPDHTKALYNRGSTLRDLGREDDAVASYDRVLALAPDHAEALVARGNALHALRRHQQALASYDRALRVKPSYAEAYNNRGNALHGLKRFDEALASYERAVELNADYAEALSNRANLLRELKRYEEAAAAFDELLTVAASEKFAQGEALAAHLTCCDWRQFDERRNAVVESVMRGALAISPFSLVAICDSAATQYKCARTYTHSLYPSRAPIWKGERYRHDRIRVAYLSGNFYNHAQATLIAGLFEAHDRTRFEITGISLGPSIDDHMQRRLRRAFEHFVSADPMSDREVAQLLREREIDIAVDLKGLSRNCRLGIFAHRAAPVQAGFLDYPGTTGAEYIDYIIADAHVIPPGQEDFYAEKVVRLPDSYQVNDSKRRIAERAPARTELGLPEDAFVFCCFNNNYKILPPMFDIWMRLLRQVDGSVLWLLGDSAAAARNLRVEAATRGVDPARLVFAARAPLPEHLARHRQADLFLDTLPCNAHTTASDALWAGLPVLTCTGNAFAARVAGSLLYALGLRELVTRDLPEYESLALKLANTRKLLAALKTKLAHNRTAYPLYDTDCFRRNIENAFHKMWSRANRGEPARSFDVPAV
jgi:protein O-GlcNAc transferase